MLKKAELTIQMSNDLVEEDDDDAPDGPGGAGGGAAALGPGGELAVDVRERHGAQAAGGIVAEDGDGAALPGRAAEDAEVEAVDGRGGG